MLPGVVTLMGEILCNHTSRVKWLIEQTTGFNDDSWRLARGIPPSLQELPVDLHLIGFFLLFSNIGM